MITVYSKPQCPYCDKAKYLLKSLGLKYEEKVVTKDLSIDELFKVLGKQALGMFLVGTDSMQESNYISEHDMKIANKLANVMAGGDLSEPTLVSEQ